VRNIGDKVGTTPRGAGGLEIPYRAAAGRRVWMQNVAIAVDPQVWVAPGWDLIRLILVIFLF
jgi:hypothetical protein